ncbi:MAG: putative oxidoreductase [Gaiellaceae bacterium]|nr:putative oxidoreductase [Gaiellaceae bacterium]
MSYGLLFLRVVIGLVFFAHGAQKLFGWWGGGGLQGTKGWLGKMGFRLPAAMALLVALSESSGLLFALGFLTPFAALFMASAMVVAIGSVHWNNGFWNGSKGYEFNLALIAPAVAVAATGPGRFSVDRALGWDDNLSGVVWGAGVLALALAGGLFVLTALRAPQTPEPA